MTVIKYLKIFCDCATKIESHMVTVNGNFSEVFKNAPDRDHVAIYQKIGVLH